MQNNNWEVQKKYQAKNPILRFVLSKFNRDIIRLVSFAEPKTILDIGCGEGFITYNLGEKITSRILAIDIEEKAIKYANIYHKRKNLDYQVGDLFKLKYENKSFDLVMCIEVLEHLEEFERAMDIMVNLSNKYVLLSVPNEPWFRIANVLRLKYLNRLGNTPGHVNNWTKRDFKKLCSKYGKIVKFKTSTFWNI